MKVNVFIKKPDWDPNPDKSKTNNTVWGNEVVIVEFPEIICKVNNKPFRWLPKYSTIQEIQKKLYEVEKVNRSKYAKHMNKEV